MISLVKDPSSELVFSLFSKHKMSDDAKGQDYLFLFQFYFLVSLVRSSNIIIIGK